MKKLFEKAVAVIALIALAVTAFPFTAPIKAETSRTELVIEPNAAVLSSDAYWEAEPVRENAVVPVRDAIWDGSIADGFSGGIGTEDDPYLISNGAELAYLAQQVNNGTEYDGAFFCLTNDIYLNDTTDWENWGHGADPANRWTPIGTDYHFFAGSLDGNGNAVHGIYVNNQEDYQGLFGFYNSCHMITNLGVSESYICGGDYVGGVVGHNYSGSVVKCYNTGSVHGNSYVGGVVGYNADYVTESQNTGSVIGSDEIGGIVGRNESTVDVCYNTGNIIGNNYVGGVVGVNVSFAADCYNTGNVSGSGCVGGIAGENGHAVIYCYNVGSVIGGMVGGLAGCNYDTVTDCYNTGSITGGYYSGGVVGWNQYESDVIDCYNTGSVSGDIYSGGLVGWNEYESIIMNCYNIGSVSGGSYVGSVVAYNDGGVEYCYYLDTSSDNGDEYCVALTDDQMREAASYIGFIFVEVWTMGGNPAYPYPELIDNVHVGVFIEPEPEPEPDPTPGDVNGDGFITAADANIAMRMALSLVEFDLAGDANGDGIVNAADANIIMRWALGL